MDKFLKFWSTMDEPERFLTMMIGVILAVVSMMFTTAIVETVTAPVYDCSGTKHQEKIEFLQSCVKNDSSRACTAQYRELYCKPSK